MFDGLEFSAIGRLHHRAARKIDAIAPVRLQFGAPAGRVGAAEADALTGRCRHHRHPCMAACVQADAFERGRLPQRALNGLEGGGAGHAGGSGLRPLSVGFLVAFAALPTTSGLRRQIAPRLQSFNDLF